MKLELIGLNHNTSPLATRERAAINPERLPDVAKRLLRESRLEGTVVLSTCNRVELYLSPRLHFADAQLRALLAEVCHLETAEAAEAYIYRDEPAAHHLFRVAAGLDSQMIGEEQVLGQVKDAYGMALELECTCSFLNGLFLRAIECGKLVRTRTGISRGAVSVAYAAIDLARRTFGRLSGRHVLLIGAGDTIQLTARYIAGEGGASCRVSNRSLEHAERVAGMVSGKVVSFPPSAGDLAWADIVVSATSSPETIISPETARQALTDRKIPILILDLAVPRDVERVVRDLPNTYLYSVDDFRDMVQANLMARQSEARKAEVLVEKQLNDFVTWYQENRIAPTIQQLQHVLEEIRSAEVQNNARRFRSEDREQVDKFSKALIHRVSGLIIANMKRASLDQNDLSLALAVTRAFASDDERMLHETLEKLSNELSHGSTP